MAERPTDGVFITRYDCPTAELYTGNPLPGTINRRTDERKEFELESASSAYLAGLPGDIYAIAQAVETPAFVVDQRIIAQTLQIVDMVKAASGCKFLYALKPFVNADVLEQMASHVDGFAASSLFEATLSREIIGNRGTVHITTPGLRPTEMCQLGALCDFVVFNSLSQAEKYTPQITNLTNCGLRVNPQLSFVKDDRYNPCRERSKLGVPMDQLKKALKKNPDLLDGIRGIHFHNNCDSKSFDPLLKTVKHVSEHLDDLLRRMEWVNLGGGYLFTKPLKLDKLLKAIDLMRSNYNLEVFIEPGATMVREAGSIIASVIDLFESEGEMIAVLDTTVNHMPEVYEYQYEPDVLGYNEDGKYVYRLVGGTCLAGDLFGEYCFDAPLEIGSRVVFPNAGAYTMVKSHMFNGINLPTLYTVSEAGQLELKKRFTYQDFTSKYGVEPHVTV